MTSEAISRLPLSRIVADRSLAYRDPLDQWAGADRLRDSIARVGVLNPITVRPSERRFQLVSGFRRVEALRERGREADVRARVVGRPLAALFVEVVNEHAGAAANLREVATALRVGRRLGLSLEQAARRLLPPLGLEPHPDLAARYLELLDLPRDLLGFFVDKGFSLRRCIPFCRLDAAAVEVATALARRLGARQLEEAMTQLSEVSARDAVPLPDLARELGLLAREEGALARLEQRRMPQTARRRAELDRLSRRLFETARITARCDPTFTSEVVELTLEVGSLEQLERRIASIESTEVRRLLARILERALGSPP